MSGRGGARSSATAERSRGIGDAAGRSLRAPFFEIGPKSRLRLSQLDLLAGAAGRAGRVHDVAVVLTVPAALVGPLHAAYGAGVLLFSQGMDPDPMGDAVGKVYAESLVDAGAAGVMLNHDAAPLTPDEIVGALARAHDCGLDTIVCAATEDEVLRAARLGPSAILFEPPSLIGTSTISDRAWIRPIDDAVRREAPGVLMMHAGGVSSPAVARSIMRSGADGTGSTSGVLAAQDPLGAAVAFIAAAREGWEAAQASDIDQAPARGAGGGAAS